MNRFISDSTSSLPGGHADEMYARQYSYAIENNLFPSLASAQVDCGRWMRGHDSISMRFPTAYNYNSAAIAASVCHDQSSARRYFARFSEPPDPDVWERVFGDPNAFVIKRRLANATR
jgi:hypothetical protein